MYHQQHCVGLKEKKNKRWVSDRWKYSCWPFFLFFGGLIVYRFPQFSSEVFISFLWKGLLYVRGIYTVHVLKWKRSISPGFPGRDLGSIPGCWLARAEPFFLLSFWSSGLGVCCGAVSKPFHLLWTADSPWQGCCPPHRIDVRMKWKMCYLWNVGIILVWVVERASLRFTTPQMWF